MWGERGVPGSQAGVVVEGEVGDRRGGGVLEDFVSRGGTEKGEEGTGRLRVTDEYLVYEITDIRGRQARADEERTSSAHGPRRSFPTPHHTPLPRARLGPEDAPGVPKRGGSILIAVLSPPGRAT